MLRKCTADIKNIDRISVILLLAAIEFDLSESIFLLKRIPILQNIQIIRFGAV